MNGKNMRKTESECIFIHAAKTAYFLSSRVSPTGSLTTFVISCIPFSFLSAPNRERAATWHSAALLPEPNEVSGVSHNI